MSASFLAVLISLMLDISDSSKPFKCYTCQSLVSNPICGANFKPRRFLQKECPDNATHCLKIIETVSRSQYMYRKCTSATCEQEIQQRGNVESCTICDESLCNATPPRHISAPIFFITCWLATQFILSIRHYHPITLS